ncbi:unnamed protein product [Arabidopsis arenosa]|uniref:Phytocyanin domain-containing protein n=1 Tax=Arabidopsis arenosa TaxID=38785 RepID=A0A8S2A202_ARAAE|nr:unnamed protein product [Arabidopsis arenosa]
MASSSLIVSIFSFIFLFSLAAANEVTVGGKSGDWKIPHSPSGLKKLASKSATLLFSGTNLVKTRFWKSGPFYFISGANGHCEKGQKLSLVVISPRHSAISPAPSPVEFEDGPALAPAPTSGSVRLGGSLYVVLGLVLGLLAWF